jgi:hypothetical protein
LKKQIYPKLMISNTPKLDWGQRLCGWLNKGKENPQLFKDRKGINLQFDLVISINLKWIWLEKSNRKSISPDIACCRKPDRNPFPFYLWSINSWEFRSLSYPAYDFYTRVFIS